jgi:hypothetical protein
MGKYDLKSCNIFLWKIFYGLHNYNLANVDNENDIKIE